MDEHIKISNVRPRILYISSENQKEFFFSFPVFSENDIKVFEDDAEKFINIDYAVILDPTSHTGSVVFNIGRPANRKITIVRSLVIERVSDFQSSGWFKAGTLNSELDFQVAALQDLAADRDRSIRLSAFDEDADLTLPSREERAGKLPSFDNDGNLIVSEPASGGSGAGITTHGALSSLGEDDHPQYHNDVRGDARYYTRSQVDSALTGKSNLDHRHDLDYASAAHAADKSNPHAVTAAQVGAAPITRSIVGQFSLNGGGSLASDRAMNFVNDEASPGPNKVYGTDSDGIRRWKSDPAGSGGVSDHGALSGLSGDGHPQYLNEVRGDARYYTHAEIDAALGTKAQTSHRHDDDYALQSHDHNGWYAPVSHLADLTNPHAVTKGQVGLGNVPNLKVNLDASLDPTSSDDGAGGYAVGSRWINTTQSTEWVCVDDTTGGATWINTTAASGTGGAPAGGEGNVQFNAGGVLNGESPFSYDAANNVLLADQEVRDATYPYNSANITGTTTACPLGYKQITRLTITGDVTSALALPTEVKEIANSAVGAATSYYALRQLIIRQDASGGHTFPEDFWGNYELSGTPAPLPRTADDIQEYLLVGEWNGTAWVCWKVLGVSASFTPLAADSSPVLLNKSNNEVLCLPGASVINLPPASGDGHTFTIVNRSGNAVTLAPNGSDTIAGSANTVEDSDTIGLIDYQVGSAGWMRI